MIGCMNEQPFLLEIKGYCPVCEQNTVFRAHGPWLRGTLICQTCPKGSVPRERALALILSEMVSDWRQRKIHESSPMERGISLILQRDCQSYIGSHYFPGEPLGQVVKGWRNENLERQTFADGSFDLVITQDVMEHVFDPESVFKEVFRTLKPGGMFISTWPIQRKLVDPITRRASLSESGEVVHHAEPEYHGNPISDQGALVTIDYGHGIHKQIAEWTGFEVRITRLADRTHGILGEYTDVVVCKKSIINF